VASASINGSDTSVNNVAAAAFASINGTAEQLQTMWQHLRASTAAERL